MHDDSYQSDHSVRDGFFDGSADDIEDFFDDDDSDDDSDDDDFPRSRRRSRRGYQDLSGAPGWVKVLVWVGALLAIAGFGVIFFGILSPAPEPISTPLTPAFPTANLPPGFPTGDLPPGFPTDALPPEFGSPGMTGFPSPRHLTPQSVGGPNLPLGFGLFFAGFVLTAIGALGHSTSRRR
ncbi:hypothetical protein [Lentzea sp. NPDC051838]|uniref:hypothetical protein n=1 Tax=Lentzea sp. NPDC051838 TaxID=3154849 RepID=UPI0034334E4B